MKQLILIIAAVLLVFTAKSQSNFSFTPTNSSATFYGQAQINGIQLTANDTIAAFDASGNCCGAAALLYYNGDAYINLVIYGDDATTPTIDEGMDGVESFYLHLYDSSEDSILIYQSVDSIVAFPGWSNTNGAPLTLYGNANVVYDFTFTLSVNGCTDPIACNYDSTANQDDGSCAYPNTGSSSVVSCNTYTWEGQTITSSGNLTHTYQNISGCDSVYTLSVTINDSTSNSTTITNCDSYTWSVNGTAYTSSGTYIDVSTNAAGCTHT